MKKIKIGILTILLLLGFLIPYVYSTISGNFAVSMIDPTNALKFYTMLGDTTNGLWVNVKAGVITSITNPVTVIQPTANLLNMTAVQPTANLLNMTSVQPTASLLNATIVGTRTHNNAVPGATNVGALIGLANAALPTYVEGNEVLASIDLLGNMRTQDISIEQQRIYVGKHFRTPDLQAIASGATYTYLIVAPNTTTRIHLGYHIQTDQRFTSYLYETPTYGFIGTAMSEFNNDRNSATTSTVAIYSAPSITTLGTNISIDLVGSSGSVGNEISSSQEIILKQNTPYLMLLTNTAAGSGTFTIDFQWYETP